MSIKDFREETINELIKRLKETEGRGREHIIREVITKKVDELVMVITKKVNELIMGRKK